MREWQQVMDVQEYYRWIWFRQKYPLDDPFWRTGQLCATVCNLMGVRRKITDFTPLMGDEQPKQDQTPEQAAAMFGAFAAAQEQKIIRGERIR